MTGMVNWVWDKFLVLLMAWCMICGLVGAAMVWSMM